MDKQFIVSRNGKDFVVYAGLLAEAHAQGLRRITTTLVQAPSNENGQVAIVAAEVETEKGVFSGIGDASPHNVNRQILPHLIRQAETRANARALRDAVNVGMTSVDELVNLAGETEQPAVEAQAAGRSTGARPSNGNGKHVRTRQTTPGEPLSDADWDALYGRSA